MMRLPYRKLTLLLATIALVATPAMLLGAKPAAKYAPPPAKPGSSAANLGDGSVAPTLVIEEPEDPPEGGGGSPVVTTSSWSVDWEIVEWGMTGHDDMSAILQDGVIQSVTITSSEGGSQTITKAQMEALGVPLPAPPTFSKGNTPPASVQSSSFSQTIPSIYGNSLTVRGTVSFH